MIREWLRRLRRTLDLGDLLRAKPGDGTPLGTALARWRGRPNQARTGRWPDLNEKQRGEQQ